MGTASVLHAEQLQSILSRAHSNTDELSDDVGVSYVFDSHVLRKTRNPHLQRITNLDLDITLLGTSLQKSTECSTADDASATCRANYTSMFQRGALRLGQFAMGGAFSGAAIHFHGFAINILLTGVRLWFFAGGFLCPVHCLLLCRFKLVCVHNIPDAFASDHRPKVKICTIHSSECCTVVDTWFS